MQIVRVNRNQVQTLGPLGALPHLVSVEATHNELEEVLDISPKALNLRSADLSFNRISQLRGTLEGYSNLTSLKLDGNMLQSVVGIQCLSYLEVLSIRDNQLFTCDGLRELKSLRQLDVSSNDLGDLGNLSALSRLEVLRAAYNHLTALGNLESLQALQSLDIANNHFKSLEEIQELRPLPLLKSLLVAGSPMMDAADVRLHVLNILPTLVSLDGVAASAEEKVHAFNLHGVDNQALKSIRQRFFPDGELDDGGGANLPPTASLVTFSDPKIAASLLSRTDYAEVDAKALAVEARVVAEGVGPLAEALVEGCEGDAEIACFVWTSSSILVPGDNLWVGGVPTFSEAVEAHAETLLAGISGSWVEREAGQILLRTPPRRGPDRQRRVWLREGPRVPARLALPHPEPRMGCGGASGDVVAARHCALQVRVRHAVPLAPERVHLQPLPPRDALTASRESRLPGRLLGPRAVFSVVLPVRPEASWQGPFNI